MLLVFAYFTLVSLLLLLLLLALISAVLCRYVCVCVCVCLSSLSFATPSSLPLSPHTLHFVNLIYAQTFSVFAVFFFFAFLVTFHLILSFLFFPYFLLSLTTNFLCIPLVLKCSYIPKYYSKCFQNDDFPF